MISGRPVIGQDYNIMYRGAGSPCVAGKVDGSMTVVIGAILDAVCKLLMPDSVLKIYNNNNNITKKKKK